MAASEEAKTELIERLRFAIDELSNPILEVWDDVLAMPIIGLVDSRRTADMVQRLLAEVLQKTGFRYRGACILSFRDGISQP